MDSFIRDISKRMKGKFTVHKTQIKNEDVIQARLRLITQSHMKRKINRFR